jgi:hypothetical protein
MGAELFYADGRTDTQRDMTKIMVTFCNFLRTHLKTKIKNRSNINFPLKC